MSWLAGIGVEFTPWLLQSAKLALACHAHAACKAHAKADATGTNTSKCVLKVTLCSPASFAHNQQCHTSLCLPS